MRAVSQIGDAWSGLTGQFLTSISLIYLAQRTQRIAVVPSPWRDDEHYFNTFAKMGDLFDLNKFREQVRFALVLSRPVVGDADSFARQTGTLVLELSDVKRFDLDHKTTEREQIGCFKGNNFADSGVRLHRFAVSAGPPR